VNIASQDLRIISSQCSFPNANNTIAHIIVSAACCKEHMVQCANSWKYLYLHLSKLELHLVFGPRTSRTAVIILVVFNDVNFNLVLNPTLLENMHFGFLIPNFDQV
jgi:hypothetical protein